MRTRIAKLLPLATVLALAVGVAPAGAASTVVRGSASDGQCGGRQAVTVDGATRLTITVSQRDATSALYAAVFGPDGRALPLVSKGIGVAAVDLSSPGTYSVLVCRNAQYDGLTVAYTATISASTNVYASSEE